MLIVWYQDFKQKRLMERPINYNWILLLHQLFISPPQ